MASAKVARPSHEQVLIRKMYRRSNVPRASSVRGERKIEQQTKSKKNVRAVIGVSTVPLSSRFTHLANETALSQAGEKPQHQVTVVKVPQKKGKAQPIMYASGGKKKVAMASSSQIQQKKLQQVAQNNRSKRQQVVSKHREGLPTQEVKKTEGFAKAKSIFVEQNGGRGAGRGSRGGRGGRGARGGREGRGGRGGRGGRDGVKTKPPTGEDLDMDMDKYWHQAGKGPDPKAAQLDRQMEEYWAAKPAQDNDAAAKTKAPSPLDAPMES